MSKVYESIKKGLEEAIEDSKSNKGNLKKRVVTIIPVKEYSAEQIKRIRNDVNMSQKLFANYIGVSAKTVEAWESGTNCPSGAASRILSMMEMDNNLTEKYPFVSSYK